MNPFRIVAVSLVAVCLLLVPQFVPEHNFSESDWRKQVEAVDPALLYAPHYQQGRYYNPWLAMENRGFGALLQWWLTPGQEYQEEEKRYLPATQNEVLQRINAWGDQDFLVWLGHNSFLIRAGGEYWLTDPMFSTRAVIPKRETPPAFPIQELASLPLPLNVIISHNHYDHLDRASIISLPAAARIFAPLGNAEYLSEITSAAIVETDWWQEIDLGNGNRLVCVPAQHWSRRITVGTNVGLWAAYLLITPRGSIFFGGDSGYFVGYTEIGRRYPGIDYAILPITAYQPRWFMHYAHMNVDESIDAFHDLGARKFIPAQWGAFALGDEPAGYPLLDLQRAIAARQLDPEQFPRLDIGQILSLTEFGQN